MAGLYALIRHAKKRVRYFTENVYKYFYFACKLFVNGPALTYKSVFQLTVYAKAFKYTFLLGHNLFLLQLGNAKFFSR